VPALVRKPKRPQTTLGDYEVHLDEVSGANIRHVSSGEIMHARLPPMEEARELYVEQARLAERLKMDLETPLTLWDVGLGAAANAMAAIECYEKQTGPVRPLHIVSFENDLDSLKLALRHRDLFLYLRHGGPATLLERGKWQSRTHPPLTWELVQGDFLETMQHASAAPDVIFYDMYSSKTASGPWSIEAFRRLFAISGERQCELLTYTYSTAARAAMLCAGFYVAAGQATGTRAETTVGLTPPALAIDGLPPRNLIRIRHPKNCRSWSADCWSIHSFSQRVPPRSRGFSFTLPTMPLYSPENAACQHLFHLRNRRKRRGEDQAGGTRDGGKADAGGFWRVWFGDR
jgi:queuine tRNA-ribosyltransferase